MKILPWVVLVSVASSLATVGAIELLHDRRAGAAAGRAIEGPVEPLRATRVPVSAAAPATRVPAPLAGSDAGWEERLLELERRVSAFELGATRQPESTPREDLPARSELRDLVLGWVAEEREARGQARQLEQEDEQRAQREFEARFQAHMLAREHGLAEWQEKEFAALFLEIGERTAEIEASIDPAVDDPREVEARWLELDEWVERRERELTARIDPALYRKIYGED